MLLHLWELLVCFLESLLITYLLHKKIGLKPRIKTNLILSVLVLTFFIGVLTFVPIITTLRMVILLGIMILVGLFIYDHKGKWYKPVIWASAYMIIVTVADILTFTIADLMVDYPLDQLMSISSARIHFTLIYLVVIAALVWLVGQIGDSNPEFPLFAKVILFVLLAVGIFGAEGIIDIALVLGENTETAKYSTPLVVLSYGILIMMIAVVVLFERLGFTLRKNKELELARQLAKAEQQHYKVLTSAAESLSKWKHDYHGQLRLISSFISQDRFLELKMFTDEMKSNLAVTNDLLLTGNSTLDAVVSLRMMDAKRHHITFKHQMIIPTKIPFTNVMLASLIGNILDNAIEACSKLALEDLEISFHIKPIKHMLYIFCTNTSDGQYKLAKNGVLLSTKPESNHGIGTRRIREIVEEVGGTCQFTPESNIFTVSILVPLEGNDNEIGNSGERTASLLSSASHAEPVVSGSNIH